MLNAAASQVTVLGVYIEFIDAVLELYSWIRNQVRRCSDFHYAKFEIK